MIKWQGYGNKDNTWEPANELPLDVVADFENQTTKKQYRKTKPKPISHSPKRLRSAEKNVKLTSRTYAESTDENERKKRLSENRLNQLASHIAPRELRSQRHCLQQNERELKSSKKIVRAKSMPVVGDFCFAKIKGFAPWPAVVSKIENTGKHIKKTIVWVEFFNSGLRFFFLFQCLFGLCN